jgi:mono/diheme cytochrome c family protein
MRKKILLLIPVIFFVFISHNTTIMAAAQDAGETLYKKHCAACHPKAVTLKSVKGMIDKMRNPPPFMPGFDEQKISDDAAKKIADYIYQGSR